MPAGRRTAFQQLPTMLEPAALRAFCTRSAPAIHSPSRRARILSAS
jgi:hypothetical protein